MTATARRPGPFRWIWGFWRPYRRALYAILGLTLINSLTSVLGAFVVQHLIDGLEAGSIGRSAVLAMVGLLVAIAVARIGVYVVLQGTRARMNLTLEWRFRQRAFECLVRLSPRWLGRHRTGDLVTRLTDDVAEKLSWFSCSGCFRALEAAGRVIVGLAAMIYLSPLLTLLSFSPLPLVILLHVRVRRGLQGRFDRRQKAISAGSDLVEAAATGIRVVKSHRHGASLRAEFAARVDERQTAEVRAIGGETLIGQLYGQAWQVALVGCLLSGGWMVTRGTLTLGTLFAMVFLVRELVWPMFDFGQFIVAAYRAFVSIDRLRSIEDAPPEVVDPVDPIDLPDAIGRLTFDAVTVRFGATTAVSDISFEVPAGSRVAVVGAIGSGKSVLARLVPRLCDPDAGAVALDGVDLRRLPLDRLRRLVAYVPQDPILFAGTIEENLRAGRADIMADEVEWACRVARFEEDLAGFADGLQTVVGARGVTLSGGQKQRVSLARALIGRPRILVLDDCTASLDAETEAALWDELDRALPGETVLLVTHRTATLEAVDRIVVLEAGRLVEVGTHQELIAAGGVYEGIYRRWRLEEAVHHER